jgi:hypothetical protein
MAASLLQGANQVDVVLIDLLDDTSWLRNVERIPVVARPQAVVAATSADTLLNASKSANAKVLRKRMKALGYEVTYWFLRAHEHGAALVQDRLFTVFYQAKDDREPPVSPMGNGLPVRSMSNLLLPVGIPPTAHTRAPIGPSPRATPPTNTAPCETVGYIGAHPVFAVSGPMPDTLGSGLKTDRGARRLQHSEVAKGKGLPSEWLSRNCSFTPAATPVYRSTCVYLWSPVMDAIAAWLTPPAVSSPSVAKATPVPPAIPWTDASSDAPTDWTWEVPNLLPGGAWHTARLASLRTAIKDLPDASQLWKEGLAALAVHRKNYTEAGPQRLQLLWWEFPIEHQSLVFQWVRLILRRWHVGSAMVFCANCAPLPRHSKVP